VVQAPIQKNCFNQFLIPSDAWLNQVHGKKFLRFFQHLVKGNR